ncbi:unnamed protein product [Polarella glacialis]|nr:unnamed protein product [Polarella glacialis]
MSSTSCAFRSRANETTITYNARFSHSWGNLLSEYWEPVGLAALSGKEFSAGGGIGGDTWMSYLPKHEPARSELKDPDAVKQACLSCNGTRYTHGCAGAWTHVRSLIQDSTQHALDEFEAKHKMERVTSGSANGKEVLFHMRLEFLHQQVQWPGLSFFKDKIPHDATKITILHMAYLDEQVKSVPGHIHQRYPPAIQVAITELLGGYKDMLQPLCGGCGVETSTNSQYHDFASIARHKGPLFVMGSSFGMWAALANVHGPVYMSSNFGGGQKPPVEGGKGAGFFWDDGKMLPNQNVSNFKQMSANEVLRWARAN